VLGTNNQSPRFWPGRKNMPIKTKSEKREEIRLKRKSSPKGGTLAGQLQKTKTSKNYAKKKSPASQKK